MAESPSSKPTEPSAEQPSGATAKAKTPEEKQAEEQRKKLAAFTDPQLVALDEAGCHSFEDVAALSDEELLAIPGIGEGTVKAWREAVPRPKAEPAEGWPSGRGDECPVCHLPLKEYEGDNPHKQGTGVCPEHGRVRLEA